MPDDYQPDWWEKLCSRGCSSLGVLALVGIIYSLRRELDQHKCLLDGIILAFLAGLITFVFTEWHRSRR